MFCQQCGTQNPDGAQVCMSCGAPMSPAVAGMPVSPGGAQDIRGFNFGAFALTTIWSFGNGQVGMGLLLVLIYIMLYIGFPFLLPIMGAGAGLVIFALLILRIGIAIYMGVKGNEKAWAARQHASVEQFKKTQLVWAIVGAVILALQIFMIPMFAAVAIPSFLKYREKAEGGENSAIYMQSSVQLAALPEGMYDSYPALTVRAGRADHV